MMRKSGFVLACVVSALALSMSACGGDDDNNNNNDNKPCTSNVCKDDSILIECKDGVEKHLTCEHGCKDNACVVPNDTGCNYADPKCSEDSRSVLTCNGGVETSKPCANGCAEGKCIMLCNFEGKQCKEDGSAVVKCIDGAEVVDSACVNGCKDNACNPPCTADACSEDGSQFLKCEGGAAKLQDCVNGCDDNGCKAPCDYNKIKCDDGGKSLMTCTDGKESVQKECDVRCVTDAYGDGADACVDKNYCKNGDDCKGREDGRTICDTDNHVCKTIACVNAECKDGQTCVLGACVPDNDLKAKVGDDCDQKTFVDHCRENVNVFCTVKDRPDMSKPCGEEGNICTYFVKTLDCKNGCAAYKDGGVVRSTCVEKETAEQVCGAGMTGSECMEGDFGMNAVVTKFLCTRSTENEPIVVISGFENCSTSNCSDDGKRCY